MKYISDKDRFYIENKYHRQDEDFNPFDRFAYHGIDTDFTDGLGDEEIKEVLDRMYTECEGEERALVKARAFAYVLDNARVCVNEHDFFPCLYNWGRPLDRPLIYKWEADLFDSLPEVNREKKMHLRCSASEMWLDTNHVVPDWKDILSLGFSGILKRVRCYHEEAGALTKKEEAFFVSIETEYEAILRCIEKIIGYVKENPCEKSSLVLSSLETLLTGAPKNTFDALMMMYLYFIFSECVDSFQVRSIGHGLDRSLNAYYRRDIESGRFTRDEIKTFLAYFFLQFSAIGNYWGQPFYLCTTDFDCKTDISDLTLDILDVYDTLGIYNPKIQIKIDAHTPKTVVMTALDMIRRGHSSIVFCCIPGITKSLMSCYGTTFEEARDCDISGCNEMHVRADEANMISSIANVAKAVAYVFDNGVDEVTGDVVGLRTGEVEEFKTFDDFYEAFIKQLAHLFDSIIGMAARYEHHVSDVNPSVMLSGTMERSLKKKVDAYAFGVKYPTSSILICSLATAIDSVLAVKELVFDKKLTTLMELKKALDANWEGYESLRRLALSAEHKYGIDDEEADRYAAAIFKWISVYVTGRSNSRGGVYKVGVPSTRHFITFGRKTKATPDGRRMGEELAKNSAPVIGMERRGVTAMIHSALKCDPYLFSEAYVLDVMLHPSAVSGDNGLEAMYAIVATYMKNGGISIQFNVFNTETLRDAQKNPEKYKNLQVRVSGWNALWNNMTPDEQHASLIRAEGLSK